MTNKRIFRIAHRLAKHYRAYNITYIQAFSRHLAQQFRFEREAKESGCLQERIDMQELILAA